MLDRETIGLIGLLVLFILILLRMPVAVTFIVVGIGGNYFLSLSAPFLRFFPYLKQFKTLLFGTVTNYNLSVVPLFILMGYFASHAKISRDLFQGLNVIFGKIRGGVAMAAIGACAGFGAVCGSSLATASTMGKVALPELKRLNYAPSLATGTLAAGGTLGILIPPSVALIIYSIIVEASIIEMFQAAIIPGILAVIFFILVIALRVRLNPELALQTVELSNEEKKKALIRLVPVLLLFGSIIVGLGIGLFTPTPAAAIGAMIILVYGLFRYRKNKDEGLNWLRIKLSIFDTAKTAGMLYLIIFGAEVLKGFFTRSGLPITMVEWALNSGLNTWSLLIIMLFLLIILGCFMDSLAMILVVIPFFWPALIQLNGGDFVYAETAFFGMDTEDLKIWFGIIALVVVELGLITPPVGLNVFIISSLSEEKNVATVFKGVIPFFLVEILRIALLLLFPAFCLFLPSFLN